MPFDANLVLIDGSITMTTSTDTPAISTTRDADTGAAVIDLKGTAASGMTAVLILPADLAGGADAYTLTGFIECSDTADMTGTTTGIEKKGYFGIANNSSGVILGSECPGVAFVHFKTTKRYCRANIEVSNSFGAPIVLLTPHVFDKL